MKKTQRQHTNTAHKDAAAIRLAYWKQAVEEWDREAARRYHMAHNTETRESDAAEEVACKAMMKAYRAGKEVMRELLKDVYRYQTNSLESLLPNVKKHLHYARLYLMDEKETAARRADAWQDVGKCINALLVLQSIETVTRLANMDAQTRENLLWLYSEDNDGAPPYIEYSRPDFPKVDGDALETEELMTPHNPTAAARDLWDTTGDDGDF